MFERNPTICAFMSYLLGALVCVTASLVFASSALASGGAFPDTKHGGSTFVDSGAWCPAPPCGVDRTLGGEVFYYYDEAEAGKYQLGECNHCHEPHASFGDQEPPPEPSAPENFLLMRGDDNELCWYCHDNMSLGFPAGPFGYGYYQFYQGRTNFNNSSHGTDVAFEWPGTGVASDPYPRVKDRTGSTDENKCINCHTPHGVAGGYDTGTAPDNLATSYDVSSSVDNSAISRQLISWEESLCLRCHDSDGPAATDIKDQVDYWGFVASTQWTTAKDGSAHPVRESTYFGRHDLANEENPSSGWMDNTNRHAECTDCHNPHTARGQGSDSGGYWDSPYDGGVFQWSETNATGLNSTGVWNTNRNTSATADEAIRLSAHNSGVWGISIDETTGDFVSVVSDLKAWYDGASSNYVYELCLKCHSYWTWGGANVQTPTGSAVAPLWNAPSSTTGRFANPPYGDSRTYDLSMTNVAWEFATDGVAPTDSTYTPASGRWSYHPVFGQGRNRPEVYTEEWSQGVRNPCWCTGPTTCGVGTNLSLADYTNYGWANTSDDCTSDGRGVTQATGTRTDLTGTSLEATLSQTFVPPWTHLSRVTCTDCHADFRNGTTGTTYPRGPHGSSNTFILRGIDHNIEYDRNGTTAYSYTGFTDADVENNLCINCHRADVYGFDNLSKVADDVPYAYLSRQQHHFDNEERPFREDQAPNDIACMYCHGAAGERLGMIHGHDYVGRTTSCSTCTDSGRLITASGTTTSAENGVWEWWAKSAVGTVGTCEKGNGTNFCGDLSSGTFNQAASYNY